MSKKLEKGFLITFSDEEREFLRKLAAIENTNERNVLRRAIQRIATANNLKIPEGLFEDRKPGNWGKENRLLVLNS